MSTPTQATATTAPISAIDEVIRILEAEMDNTLALIGCPRAENLSGEFLA